MPPLIGPDPFIGREREMAELTAALDGALEGRGGARCSWANPGKDATDDARAGQLRNMGL